MTEHFNKERMLQWTQHESLWFANSIEYHEIMEYPCNIEVTKQAIQTTD